MPYKEERVADTQYDLAVIGSGPGGYVAAIRASQLGLKCAIVEKDPALGGVCLNVGCIPSKAFLHTAELLENARDGKRIGFAVDNPHVDWSGLMGHKERVIKQMTGGVASLMKKNKVDVFKGFGRLSGPNSISVKGEDGSDQTVNAKTVLVATGSRPKSLPFAKIDEDRILSSTGILDLKELPKRLVIIGGGVIGSEMATAFHGFGTDVTILEALPRIVRLADEEISAELQRAFQRKGIKVFVNAKVGGIDPTDNGVAVMYTDADGKEQHIEADRVLVAVAREPLTSDIGLEDVGVEKDERGYVKVNEYMQTNIPSVYSLGDCVGKTGLAHVASAEGIVAAEHIAGHHTTPVNYDKVPAPYWCSPQIGHAGLTEAQAKERGYETKVSKFPFSANGHATILTERVGFVKIVADAKYDEILGIHIIGPHATELLGEVGVALSHEATSESLASTVHAHPTIYEAIMEAAHGLIDGPINM